VLVAGLQTSHAIALGVVAGIFIAFALLSSLVIPRYRPDFPGEKGLKPFLAVAVVLFVAMLLAVEFFAAEPTEATSTETTTTATTGTASTSTGATTTSATTTSQAPAGNAANGKALYTSLGCVGCHSLDGTNGTGPTFKGLAGSQVKLSDGTTVTADDAYLSESIADPDKQLVTGHQAGIMSAVIKPGAVSATDIADLVAFIKTVK
jgi:cytochrome c2